MTTNARIAAEQRAEAEAVAALRRTLRAPKNRAKGAWDDVPWRDLASIVHEEYAEVCAELMVFGTNTERLRAELGDLIAACAIVLDALDRDGRRW